MAMAEVETEEVVHEHGWAGARGVRSGGGGREGGGGELLRGAVRAGWSLGLLGERGAARLAVAGTYGVSPGAKRRKRWAR